MSNAISAPVKHGTIEKNQRDNQKLVHGILKLHRDLIVIGLTGRTGSGCSTTADILSKQSRAAAQERAKEKCDELKKIANSASIANNSNVITDGDDTHINQLKRGVISTFLNIPENWPTFKQIKIRDIILLYSLAHDDFEYVKSTLQFNTKKSKVELENLFSANRELAQRIISSIESNIIPEEADFIEQITQLFDEKIPQISHLLKEDETQKSEVSRILQEWANSIRKIKSINPGSDKNVTNVSNPSQPVEDTAKAQEESITSSGAPAERICQTALAAAALWIINLYKSLSPHESSKFVIDSFRNPYEILFFKANVPNFYLISVNMNSELRKARLHRKGYDENEIKAIDKDASTKASEFTDSYTKVDIDKCIELSDIYIDFNLFPSHFFSSYISQLETISALLMHPGLIPPTDEERVMQVALTAKLNSGCLSRQVGAAITNKDFSILSIGWNIVPGGQTPCNLRALNQLYQLQKSHKNRIRRHKNNPSKIKVPPTEDFSIFEITNSRFRCASKQLWDQYCMACPSNSTEHGCIEGLSLSYCFKDVYNSSQEDETKRSNQVHTRSIHAEENAFLQLAKYGSMGIEGDYLFTTASCCVLCAKKAYQLGISRIYYVDSYPDISEEHILQSGERHKWPEVILFRGALGKAYINLYTALIPLKDEIQYLSGINTKEACIIKDSKSSSSKKK